MISIFNARLSSRLTVGLALGAGIAAVDNLARGGEASPIVVVAFLLIAATLVCAAWGRRGLPPAVALWACVPLAHVVKHLLGLPDTLHPNTCASILKLAAFSFVMTAVGTGCGTLIHKAITRAPDAACE